MDNMNAYVVWVSGVLLVGSLCLLLFSSALAVEAKTEKIKKLALRMLLFSLIGAVVGFGVCSAFFELNLH